MTLLKNLIDLKSIIAFFIGGIIGYLFKLLELKTIHLDDSKSAYNVMKFQLMSISNSISLSKCNSDSFQLEIKHLSFNDTVKNLNKKHLKKLKDIIQLLQQREEIIECLCAGTVEDLTAINDKIIDTINLF